MKVRTNPTRHLRTNCHGVPMQVVGVPVIMVPKGKNRPKLGITAWRPGYVRRHEQLISKGREHRA